MAGKIYQYRPSELYYTHNSISMNFCDGTPLGDTLGDILVGEVETSFIEPMVVMKHYGKLYVVMGNRRLYLYKKLEEEGLLETVPVRKVPFDHKLFWRTFTTKNGGTSVRVRGDHNGTFDRELEEAIDDYTHGIREFYPRRKASGLSRLSYDDSSEDECCCYIHSVYLG